MAFRVLCGLTPPYMNDLVRVADLPSRRQLRSSSSHQLLVPPFRLTTVGRRTFPVAASSLLCNSLPSDIQSSPSLQLTAVWHPVIPVSATHCRLTSSHPRLCNSLPSDIQSSPSLPVFRHRLKTFIFRQSFPDIVLWLCCAFMDFILSSAILATLKVFDWHWH